MHNPGPMWLLPRPKSDKSAEPDYGLPSDEYQSRLTLIAASWLFCAAASAFLTLLTGAFENWHPLIYMGLAKALIVALLGIAIGRRIPATWAPGVVVPALYAAIGCFMAIGSTASFFSSPPQGDAILFVQSLVLVIVHTAFLCLLSRTVWVCFPAFQVPRHLRWRQLVRRGIPIAIALLAVDVVVMTRFYWQ